MNTGQERERMRMAAAAAAGSGTQNTSPTAPPPPPPREGGGNGRDTRDAHAPEVGGSMARGGLRRVLGLPELRQGESERRKTETEVSD